MKTRELSTVVGIFAMCAFGLVFMGCGNAGGGYGGSEGPTRTWTPIAADFMIENLSQIKKDENSVIIPVTITPYSGGSRGAISVYYNGSTTLPTEKGAYAVTFDVAAATGWNAARGLAAGTLTINDTVIKGLPALLTYLQNQVNNNKNTPYYIAIEIDDSSLANIRATLNSLQDKYVYLDLSPSSIWRIPDSAFYGKSSPYGCDTLVGITIPNSVLDIGQYAFCQLKNFASVAMGNNVDTIGTYAFQNCTSLTSVIIPDSVLCIESQAFRGCDNLTSVTFQGTINTKYFSNNIPFTPDLPFPNDLRTKFYEKDKIYGTPGTYTRSGNGTTDSPYTWTRQP